MSRYKFALVNQQVDGLQYITSYVKLKKVGLVYKGVCPFHNEKTGSFTVYPKDYVDPKTKIKQDHTSFYCFGCGAGGDVITFKQLKLEDEIKKDDSEEITRLDACNALIEEMGLQIDDENAEIEFLKEERNVIENSDGLNLSYTEVNLICSSICRNYVGWVRENYPNKLLTEIEAIEKYYRYIDNNLLEFNVIEANKFIKEVQQKIDKRRFLLKEGI